MEHCGHKWSSMQNIWRARSVPGDCGSGLAKAGITPWHPEVVGDCLELLRGIGVRERSRQQIVVIHVAHAVEHVKRAALAATAGAGTGFRRERESGLDALATVLENIGGAGGEQNQAGWIATVQRQFLDGGLADGYAQFRRGGVDQFGVRGDGYDLGGARRNLQRDILRAGHVGGKLDALLR